MTAGSLLARVANLSTTLKIASAGIVLAAAVAAVSIGTIARSARVPLFAQTLHAEQLGEVQERLAEWNVAFTPTANNVLVNAPERSGLLLRLSLAGIPHAHVVTTDESLAAVGVLTPQSVIDAQARAGLAGEIELALRTIQGIDDARVIVAPARAAEFADERTQGATASVRLRMHAGAALTAASISGIRAFVAASVPGLSADRVTLLDDRGVALGAAPVGTDDASALQASLQSALDASLGPGLSIVRVHADYSMAEREARDVRRVPVSQTAILSRVATESYDAAGKRYAKSKSTRDRGSDVRERVSRVPSGTLVRVSTAVFVDASRSAALASVRQLAAAAVGFDARRGDTLTVEAVQFHRERRPVRDGWLMLYGALVPLLPVVALMFGLGASVRFAAPHVGALVQRIVERDAIARTAANVAGLAPSRVHGALAQEPPHAAAAIISALPAATAAAVLELYPAHEREAIVRRMGRVHSPLVPDAESVVRHA